MDSDGDARVATWGQANRGVTIGGSSGVSGVSGSAVLGRRMAVGTYRAPVGLWIVGRDEAIQVDDNIPGGLSGIIARECFKAPRGCPQEVENEAHEMARDARHRAEATLSTLGDLIDALAALEGPKHLVLVTGGPVSTINNHTTIAGPGERAALARVTRSLIRVDYGVFKGLDFLVPLQMWEWHEGVNQLGLDPWGALTGVQGLATYSKIRRFQVSTSEIIK